MLLAGLGIDPRCEPCGSDLERSKTNKLDRLGFLDTRFDAVDDCINGALGVGFTGSEVLDRRDKFRLCSFE